MKKIILIISLTVLQASCSLAPKISALEEVQNEKIFKGFDTDTRGSYSFPEYHNGPFLSIEQFNFKISAGLYKGLYATAIMAKSREQEKWQVLKILVKKDGFWIELPKKQK